MNILEEEKPQKVFISFNISNLVTQLKLRRRRIPLSLSKKIGNPVDAEKSLSQPTLTPRRDVLIEDLE